MNNWPSKLIVNENCFQTPVVEETGKRIIESDGDIQRLVIVSADVTDRGQYICLAENAEGKAESKATLTVLGKFVKSEGSQCSSNLPVFTSTISRTCF